MAEPVKLSRERWEMLREAKTRYDANAPALEQINAIVSTTLANRLDLLVVREPLETQGVIFLPADYVPDNAWIDYRGQPGRF